MAITHECLRLLGALLLSVILAGGGAALAQEPPPETESRGRRLGVLRGLFDQEQRDEEWASLIERLATRSVERRFNSAAVRESACGRTFCVFVVQFAKARELDTWLEEMVFDDPFNSSGLIFEGEKGLVTVFFARKGHDLPRVDRGGQ